MGVTITGKKIVLEFPKEEFEVLEPAAIEKEVFNELKKLKAVKDFSSGKISEKELVRILGPEKALNIIEAKEITEKSIKRAINEEEAKNNKTMTKRN
jgi:hypothetical protein